MTSPRRSLLACLLTALAFTGCRQQGAVTTEEMPRVVAALSGRAAARERAVERLLETPRTVSWPALVALFDDPGRSKPEARTAAIRIFGRTAGSAGLPPIVMRSATEDPDPAVRRSALSALAASGNPAHHDPLLRAARRESDPTARSFIDAALEELARNQPDWYARTALEAPFLDERLMALRGIGSAKRAEDLVVVREVFRRASEEVMRQEAILVAAEIDSPEARAFVREQLASADGYVRGAAAAASIGLLDPDAVPLLAVVLAKDPIGDIRISAARALAGIRTDAALASLKSSCSDPPSASVRRACDTALLDATRNGSR